MDRKWFVPLSQEKKMDVYCMDDRGSESSNGQVYVMTRSEMDDKFVDG
jgi:hypothetical protein